MYIAFSAFSLGSQAWEPDKMDLRIGGGNVWLLGPCDRHHGFLVALWFSHPSGSRSWEPNDLRTSSSGSQAREPDRSGDCVGLPGPGARSGLRRAPRRGPPGAGARPGGVGLPGVLAHAPGNPTQPPDLSGSRAWEPDEPAGPTPRRACRPNSPTSLHAQLPDEPARPTSLRAQLPTRALTNLWA